jgi:hypothetical protein
MQVPCISRPFSNIDPPVECHPYYRYSNAVGANNLEVLQKGKSKDSAHNADDGQAQVYF